MWITSMGNHGMAGGISERRHSSCSSWHLLSIFFRVVSLIFSASMSSSIFHRMCTCLCFVLFCFHYQFLVDLHVLFTHIHHGYFTQLDDLSMSLRYHSLALSHLLINFSKARSRSSTSSASTQQWGGTYPRFHHSLTRGPGSHDGTSAGTVWPIKYSYLLC